MGVGDHVEVGVILGNDNAGAAAGGFSQLRLPAAVGPEAVEIALDLLHGDVGDGHHTGQGFGGDV